MKRTKYPIHPDFKFWSHMNPPINKALLPFIQGPMRLLYYTQKSSGTLSVQRLRIESADGGSLRALLYSPAELPENAPCLLYLHGGGFVFPAAPNQYALMREYALQARCKVLFVDYRLAPKYPFPIPTEDCYSAYRWLLANAEGLSVDPGRIAVGGDSAGGELATVLCLMAMERGQSLPCGQMLIYPAVGRGLDTQSERQFTDTPMCNSRDMEKYDKLYIPDETAGKREYASPIHAPSLAGLPHAYIETAEFDCLRDGALLYADRLMEAGVPVELHNTKGTMHGFDMVLKSPIVRECVRRRTEFLKKVFSI